MHYSWGYVWLSKLPPETCYWLLFPSSLPLSLPHELWNLDGTYCTEHLGLNTRRGRERERACNSITPVIHIQPQNATSPGAHFPKHSSSQKPLLCAGQDGTEWDLTRPEQGGGWGDRMGVSRDDVPHQFAHKLGAGMTSWVPPPPPSRPISFHYVANKDLATACHFHSSLIVHRKDIRRGFVAGTITSVVRATLLWQVPKKREISKLL